MLVQLLKLDEKQRSIFNSIRMKLLEVLWTKLKEIKKRKYCSMSKNIYF